MRRRALISIVAVALGLLWAADTCPAADDEPTYVVSACSVDGVQAPTEGWTRSSTPVSAGSAFDDCGGSHEMGFTLGPGSGAVGRWTFSPPPGTVVDEVMLYALVASGDSLAKLSFSTGSGVTADLPWPFLRDLFASGAPLTIDVLGGPPYVLEFRCPLACASTTSLRVARVDIALRDLAAPEVRFDATTRSLHFTDVGGGVEFVQLEVDGSVREVRVGDRCRRPFVHLVPCVVDGAVALGDLGLEPGQRSVFATVIDAAGNRTYSGPHVIDIPAQPASPGPTPPRMGSLIVDGASRRRVAYKAATIRGIVRDLEGFPIGRAQVEATMRVGGGGWKPLAPTVTDAQGKFAVIVPRGPSREVRLSYLASDQTVRLSVAAPVRLSIDRKLVRNGRTVTFRGSVAEAGPARTRITLQAWARGKWMPFRSVALKNGKFRARYRFSGTYATTRYRFRAVIGNDPNFIFAAGRSRTVSVVVQPKGARR